MSQAPPAYTAPPGPPPTANQAQAPIANDDSPSNPGSYIRDPHKLIGYLIPFPPPQNLHGVPAPPLRFILYTPPPPPLMKPQEGEKESKTHKIQRKWQEEVRTAKTSDAKVASWKGIKSKVTKGISWAVDKTTSADLDFVTRIPRDDKDEDAKDGDTKATVKLEELVFVYPPSINQSPEQLRTEFVNNLMRTKSKAEKDAVIASGLLPIAAAMDWALIFIGWIFGGFLEVDGVWAASSIKGARTARSISKRLASSTKNGDPHSSNDTIKINFTPSERVAVLQSYLQKKCVEVDSKRFGAAPGNYTEEDVMEAIGWTPSGQYEEKNWEDESWERTAVSDDIKVTLEKAAKTWDHWVKEYEKNPKKAEEKQ